MSTVPIEKLAAPFAQEMIRQRKGSFGKQLSYVESSAVIQRLNDATVGDWSFEVVNVRFETDEIIVHGRLTIADTIREQFGSSKVTRNRDTGEAISLGDDCKSASSDALKKTAAMVGVALHLYSDSTAYRPVNQNGNNNHNGNGHHSQSTNSNNRISNEAIADLFMVAREVGVKQADVIKYARETFNNTISGLTPDQGEELMTIITNHAA